MAYIVPKPVSSSCALLVYIYKPPGLSHVVLLVVVASYASIQQYKPYFYLVGVICPTFAL